MNLSFMNKQDVIAEQVDALNQMQSKLAQQLSNSHDQMRGLAKRVWRVQEEERKQIAQELHDGVGQLLTALINQLEQVGRQNQGIEINDTLDLARLALSETREISRLMRPRILDDLGLIAALQWLVRVMAEKGKTEIVLRNEIERELDLETQTLIFRVVQEALTNAVKHAKASKIVVSVSAKAQILSISIKDNGVGMDQTKTTEVQGFGLSAMQDRVVAFGGHLQVDSRPGDGCQIIVLLTRIDN
jgi:two-component system, NarL family, sensor kinase